MKAHRVMDARKAHEIWEAGVNSDMQTAIALVLYILKNRGWHKDRLAKLFEDYVSELSHPMVFFGKEVDNEMMMDYIEKAIGIDLSRVKVRCESFDPKRYKFL